MEALLGEMEDGLSCLTEASANTQGALAASLKDRKPDLGTRLAHVRCALSVGCASQPSHPGGAMLQPPASLDTCAWSVPNTASRRVAQEHTAWCVVGWWSVAGARARHCG